MHAVSMAIKMMDSMNALAFVNFLLIKIFPTLIRQIFPPSKFCTIWYIINTFAVTKWYLLQWVQLQAFATPNKPSLKMWRLNILAVFTAHPKIAIIIISYVARGVTHSSQQTYDSHPKRRWVILSIVNLSLSDRQENHPLLYSYNFCTTYSYRYR